MSINVKIYRERLERLSKLTAKAEISTVIVNNPSDVFYYSGFKSSNAIIVITDNAWLFLTDFRYYESAFKTLNDVFTVVKASCNLYLFSDQSHVSCHSGKLGLSFSYTSYSVVRFLKSKFDSSIEFVDIDMELRSIRSTKDQHEISIIENALELSEKIIVDAFSWLSCRPDSSEIELQSFVRTRLLHEKAIESFETISAFGANAANCHATPTAAVYSSNSSCCLIDMGAKKNYYCSDITRTVISGTQLLNSQKMQDIRNIVIEAKQSSIEKVAPGVICADVDRADRDIISRHGYGDFFGHGMGHGVGVEIHEYPSVSPLSQAELVPGMIITIEPGIYLPDLGGIRMEDMVLVTPTGYRVLNKLGDDW